MNSYIYIGLILLVIIILIVAWYYTQKTDNLADLDKDIIAHELVGTGLNANNANQSRTIRLLSDLEEPYY